MTGVKIKPIMMTRQTGYLLILRNGRMTGMVRTKDRMTNGAVTITFASGTVTGVFAPAPSSVGGLSNRKIWKKINRNV